MTYYKTISAKTKAKKYRETISFHYNISPSGTRSNKKTLMANWSQRENQPLLKTIFKRPSMTSYKRGKSKNVT